MELSITTTTSGRDTLYTSDESTMSTQAFQALSGEWWVYINGRRDIHEFDSRSQAENYAKTALAVHIAFSK